MLPCLLRVSIIYKKFLQIPTDIFISYKYQSGCELKEKHWLVLQSTYSTIGCNYFYMLALLVFETESQLHANYFLSR